MNGEPQFLGQPTGDPAHDRRMLVENLKSGLLFAVRRAGSKIWIAPDGPPDKYLSLHWDVSFVGKPHRDDPGLFEKRLAQLNKHHDPRKTRYQRTPPPPSEES